MPARWPLSWQVLSGYNFILCAWWLNIDKHLQLFFHTNTILTFPCFVCAMFTLMSFEGQTVNWLFINMLVSFTFYVGMNVPLHLHNHFKQFHLRVTDHMIIHGCFLSCPYLSIYGRWLFLDSIWSWWWRVLCPLDMSWV